MTTLLLDSRPASQEWPEFVGSWPRLKGRQFPEFESRFDGDESEGDRCARFGARIGLRCMPWEWLTLRAMLSLQPANEWGERVWTHRDVCVECTRQQGKTLLIVLRILFGMFVLREKRIIYTAQRWSTAYDVFKRVCAVIDRVPSLKRRLADKPSKAGNRGVIRLSNGCEVEFGPRSQDFGRGYTEIDLLIVDEAYDVDPGEEANLTGAQSAAKNPQTIYISTPPVIAKHPKCHTLANLHRMGRRGAPDLYYALYAAPRDIDREDPAAWALAQPSFGVATNEREIRSKLHKAKTVEQRAIFDADYLGWGDYPPDEDEIGSPIPDEVWEAQKVERDPAGWPQVRLTGARVLAVHRSRNRKVWAILAAQFTADGRVHIEQAPLTLGSHTEVAEYLVTKVTEWNPAALVIDRRNGAQVLEQLLLDAGIEPVMSNTSDMAAACSGMLDDALGLRLSHSDQALLNDAVVSAQMRELPGGDFAWLEDDAGVAIPLVGASLARWGLVKFGPKRKGMPARPVTAAKPGGGRQNDFDAMSAAF